MQYAVMGLHFEVMKWLRANGWGWEAEDISFLLSTWVIRFGDLEMVKWLYDNGCPFYYEPSVLSLSLRKKKSIEIEEYLGAI
eukprot:791898-Prorocentrum_minimum.AAC.1